MQTDARRLCVLRPSPQANRLLIPLKCFRDNLLEQIMHFRIGGNFQRGQTNAHENFGGIVNQLIQADAIRA